MYRYSIHAKHTSLFPDEVLQEQSIPVTLMFSGPCSNANQQNFANSVAEMLSAKGYCQGGDPYGICDAEQYSVQCGNAGARRKRQADGTMSSVVIVTTSPFP